VHTAPLRGGVARRSVHSCEAMGEGYKYRNVQKQKCTEGERGQVDASVRALGYHGSRAGESVHSRRWEGGGSRMDIECRRDIPVPPQLQARWLKSRRVALGQG
jgi:hypothetical protein